MSRAHRETLVGVKRRLASYVKSPRSSLPSVFIQVEQRVSSALKENVCIGVREWSYLYGNKSGTAESQSSSLDFRDGALFFYSPEYIRMRGNKNVNT